MTENYPYISPTPGKFPIIVDEPVVIPDGSESPAEVPTPEDCISIKDALNNCMSKGMYHNLIEKTVENIRNTGLKIGLHNYLFKNPDKCENEVNRFIPYKNSIGFWDLGDEPNNMNANESVDDVLARLRQWADAYHKICAMDTGRMCVFTLSHTEWDKGELWTSEMILDKVQEYFRPSVWCFDVYPVYVEIDKKAELSTVSPPVYDESSLKIRGHYFPAYEAIRNISIQTARPFWAYIQCIEFVNKESYEFQPVTLGTLRLQANTALAYGAQGLRYWRYSISKPHGNEIYYQAPLLDNDGKTSDIWKWMHQVNLEIQLYSRPILELK